MTARGGPTMVLDGNTLDYSSDQELGEDEGGARRRGHWRSRDSTCLLRAMLGSIIDFTLVGILIPGLPERPSNSV
jgi:hypothetical protein